MPQKRNSAGNMQNYVPAGNGDASGEYGDNATGSNVHFKTFKKPESNGGETTSTTTSQTQTKNASNVTKNTNETITNANASRDTIVNNILNKFKKNQKENSQEFAQKIFDESNDNIQILNNLLEQNENFEVRYGNAGRNAAGCAWGSASVTLTGKSVHTYRHELGHTWDSYFGKDMQDNRSKYPMSNRIVTQYIDDVEKMSFDELIHEELGINGYDTVLSGWNIRYRKRGVDKIENKRESIKKVADVFNEYCNSVFDKLSGIENSYEKLKELKAKRKETENKIREESANDPKVKDLGKEYDLANSRVYSAEAAYSNAKMREGAAVILYSQSPDVMEARKNRDIARDKYSQALENKREELKGKYGLTSDETNLLNKLEDIKNFKIYKEMHGLAGIMGDTEDYMGVYGSKYETNGHGSNYFNQRKDDGYSCEIWANMFDCYLDKKGTWEVVKKMLPRSSEMFERVVKKFGGKK